MIIMVPPEQVQDEVVTIAMPPPVQISAQDSMIIKLRQRFQRKNGM